MAGCQTGQFVIFHIIYNICSQQLQNSEEQAPKQMSSIIPNVSSIYRDLSHISSNINRNDNGYNLQSKNHSSKGQAQLTCFEDLYAYKEKRHRELMNKLKSSTEEYNMILGNANTANPNRQNSSMTRQQYQPYQYQPYNSNINPNISDNAYSSRSADIQSNNFIMPKIRYRHIEDQKQKNTPSQSQLGNQYPRQSSGNQSSTDPKQELLQRQFYQDIGESVQKQKPRYQSKPNIISNIAVQTKGENNLQLQQQDNISQLSQTNSNMRLARTSKINKQYEDKIESYYELCRKKLGDQQAVQKHSGRDHQDGKFMRSNGGKVKGMGLDEAIKLLTLD